MKLLDLFCGAGGASVGYHRAGFEVIGIDNRPQKNYPFEFYQANAFDFCAKHGSDFDVIHASPPCQGYSISRNNGCHLDAPKLIENVREMLVSIGKPYIIENVVGAPLHGFLLCGASFGLKTGKFDLPRHRLFETSWFMLVQPCQHKRGSTIGVYGHGTNSYHRKKFGRCLRITEMREAMGIDWMTRGELSQAIPPAYTEYIGKQLMSYLVKKQDPGYDARVSFSLRSASRI
jgi:DNA (cytosine-5)-methyltransferase 1